MEDVVTIMELDTIVGLLVGIPGQNGLSVEQRKRLTIAVELVANPRSAISLSLKLQRQQDLLGRTYVMKASCPTCQDMHVFAARNFSMFSDH